MTDEKLVALAKEAMKNAYAPYSKFQVGAALLAKDGRVFTGCNVENASYGAAICAERNAITTAIAMGYKKGDFNKIHVMVSGEKLSTPCFVCRQVITEFFDKDSEVILVGKNGESKTYKVSEMCPYPLDSEDL